jgi:hypothetical protein
MKEKSIGPQILAKFRREEILVDPGKESPGIMQKDQCK